MKVNCIYQIKFRYSDEEDFRDAYVLVYQTGTVLGDTIAHALDEADEDGDYSGLDKLLYDHYGLTDGGICFYYDTDDAIGKRKLENSLELAFDIVVRNMWVDRESKYERD